MKVSHLTWAIKVIGTIWLILGTLSILSYIDSDYQPAPKLSSQMTNAELQTWFAGYNEEYFLGQLPKNTAVEWADLSAYDSMGRTFRTDSGWRVLIDRKTNPVA